MPDIEKSKFTTFTERSWLSFEDREMLCAVLASVRRFDLAAASRSVYWWWHNENWRFSPLRALELRENRMFDRRHGTDTMVRVPLTDLEIESGNKDHGVYYQASPVTSTRKVIGGLGIDYSDYVFIDLGSGKGRVLLIASEFPFKEVVGVEFSRELHEIAQNNIEKYGYKRAAVTRSTCCDAADYEFPNENLVLFLYNPFDAFVMRRVIENLRESIDRFDRRLMIIYFYPAHRDLYEKIGHLRVIRSRRKFLVLERTED